MTDETVARLEALLADEDASAHVLGCACREGDRARCRETD
jgi:hypothetical protein